MAHPDGLDPDVLLVRAKELLPEIAGGADDLAGRIGEDGVNTVARLDLAPPADLDDDRLHGANIKRAVRLEKRAVRLENGREKSYVSE